MRSMELPSCISVSVSFGQAISRLIVPQDASKGRSRHSLSGAASRAYAILAAIAMQINKG
jgi:hypothetical protein